MCCKICFLFYYYSRSRSIYIAHLVCKLNLSVMLWSVCWRGVRLSLYFIFQIWTYLQTYQLVLLLVLFSFSILCKVVFCVFVCDRVICWICHLFLVEVMLCVCCYARWRQHDIINIQYTILCKVVKIYVDNISPSTISTYYGIIVLILTDGQTTNNIRWSSTD